MFSFWQQDTFFQPADIVIVGAGFMGLWCAYELKMQQPSLKITVLDRENFPGGASIRNAGFACFGSPGEMLHDAAAMGEKGMWDVVNMRYLGIQKLRRVLGDEIIQYDACGGYECFAEESLFEDVHANLAWLNSGMQKITGENASFTITDEALHPLGLKNFNHLISNRLEGGLHSGKTIQALLQKLALLDITLLFGTTVTAWEQTTNGILVFGINGKDCFEIKAGRLLLTTNAAVTQLIPEMPVQPARGQVLVTQPIEGLSLRGTFHFDEGFYYWRNIGNRILLGGARNQAFAAENTAEPESTALIQQALENFLDHHVDLPVEKRTIDFRWAGIMGFTRQKQPVIYQPANQVWAAVACNGMGVALAPIIAETIASQLLNC